MRIAVCLVLFLAAACSKKSTEGPTADVIGSCQKHEGKDVYYKGYELGPADVLEKDCTGGGGTWAK